jgi:hypothetical protein
MSIKRELVMAKTAEIFLTGLRGLRRHLSGLSGIRRIPFDLCFVIHFFTAEKGSFERKGYKNGGSICIEHYPK